MPIKALVFDHDGVLAEFDHRAAAAFFQRELSVSLEEIGRQWKRWMKETPRQDLQELSWERFSNHLGEGLKLTPEQLGKVKAFSYVELFRAFPDSVPALRRARDEGLRIAVLSNTPLVDLRAPMRHIGLEQLVDLISNPMLSQLSKPAPEAYLHISRTLGVEPSECLFFDDAEVNVAGAEAVGMRGYRVDRRRAEHALADKVIRDLSALAELVSRG
jgi:putative hydrolase of the HAD superfamily